MVAPGVVPAFLRSPYRCAVCQERVAQADLPTTIWVEDLAALTQRLYHTRCWLAWRSVAA